ncbi:META domain-containing protein [Gordonia sp. 'Campus']|uniref:META domain-containing protein n=1 Tax=Gordonia sp. 'Campus' TaxID=2915824 RepID=UPI001EE452E1|nr:META domain-containing protein [Gordonia sp. 'Campus']
MALLLSAVIVALGPTAVAAGQASAAPGVPGFVGKTYASTAVTGEQIPGGGPLEVSFPAANRISLTAGCNRHIGDLRVDNSLLRLGSLASTMMACPGPRSQADAWITEFTREPLTWYSVGHALVLVGPGSQVLLTERPA